MTGCIVLYNNNKNILQQAINSFLNCEIVNKLYLIDNSPTDNLKDICVDERVEYIHNPSNPGFGAAHNIAIEKALQSDSKYHIVLNPDVYFDNNVIFELKKYMDDNLINLEDLEDVLNQLKDVKYDKLMEGQSAEMEASQKRYEEYIKKNIE